MFLIVALFVLLAGASFTAATWTHFTDMNGWIGQGAAALLVGGFVVVIFTSFRREHAVLRTIGKITAVAVGFLNYALIAAVACWLAEACLKLMGISWNPASIAFALFGLAAIVTLYGLLNAAALRVTWYTVRLPKLPEPWRGRNIALVTDLHVGNIRGPKFIQHVVDRLQQLEPDAVLIAGDMFDGAKVDIARSVAPWTTLRTPHGIYFVTGNHDEFNARSPYLSALTNAGVRVLDNEKVIVDGLQIVGVHDSETHQPEIFREILQRANLDRNGPSILLAHQPRHLPIPAEAGISLQVSGHTHAGQFWPWSLLVKRIFGPFAYGLNRLGALQVVTSSGAGSWGPPMRVGTKAEIVMLRLEA